MKKTHFLLLSLFLLCSCQGQGEASSSYFGSKEDNTIELFPDNHFENGFKALPGNKSFANGTYPENDFNDDVYLKYDENTPNGTWQIQQTGCIYDLNDVYNPITEAYPSKEGDFYKFEGYSNYLRVNPSSGEIVMGLDASKEYEAPRKDRENWPHLLLQTSLVETTALSELEALQFSIDLSLSVENKMSASEYNPSLHAAQFLLYFIVNSSSAVDAGEYFWFGIPFYDNRDEGARKPSAMIDNGTSGNTGKVIYQMGTSKIDPEGFQLEKDYDIRLDLLEEFSSALLEVQKLGRLTSTTVEDLSISYMNIGFELPGTFDCEARFSNFSLLATKGN